MKDPSTRCRKRRGVWTWVVAIAVTSGLFLAAGGSWLASATAPAAAFSPDLAYERARDGTIALIDVRAPAEWRETGVPVGAHPVMLVGEGGRPNVAFVDEVLAVVNGDRDTSIAVICARGVRSLLAARLLRASGFDDVHDVPAGVVGRVGSSGWLDRGLPVEPCAERCEQQPIG